MDVLEGILDRTTAGETERHQEKETSQTRWLMCGQGFAADLEIQSDSAVHLGHKQT